MAEGYEDIERLKKIIILRKIGMSVEDIRHILDNTLFGLEIKKQKRLVIQANCLKQILF